MATWSPRHCLMWEDGWRSCSIDKTGQSKGVDFCLFVLWLVVPHAWTGRQTRPVWTERESVTFICNVCFPFWVKIKINHNWLEGPEMSCFSCPAASLSQVICMACSLYDYGRQQVGGGQEVAILRITSILGDQDMGDSSPALLNL